VFSQALNLEVALVKMQAAMAKGYVCLGFLK
jgi:hypothetical protein